MTRWINHLLSRSVIFIVLLYRVTLGQVMGGHCRFQPTCSQYMIDAVQKYGPIKLPSAHEHLRVGPDERDAWLLCMESAISEQDYAAEFKAYLLRELRVPAERIVQVSRDPIASD